MPSFTRAFDFGRDNIGVFMKACQKESRFFGKMILLILSYLEGIL